MADTLENTTIAPVTAPVRTPEMVVTEIQFLKASTLNNLIEIGRRLVELKEMIPYGQFGEYVEKKTGFSSTTAGNYMKLYTEYGSPQGNLFGTEALSQTFGNLHYSKALAMLSVPAEEREAFAEEVDAEHISVRELKRRIAEREAEAAAARKSAEEETAKRLQAEDDLKGVRYELQMSRQAGMELGEENRTLKEELKAAKTTPVLTEPDELLLAEAVERGKADAVAEMQGKLDEANEAARQSAKAAESLRKELDALKKSLPADQVVEEAVRKATEEAIAEVQSKLDKARQEKKEADAKRNAAEKALDEANEAARQSAKAAEELRKELAAASENQQAEAVSGDRALYKVLCEQILEGGNKLHGLLLKAESGDPQLAGRICKTFGMISRKFAECAASGNAQKTSGTTEGGVGNDGNG